MRRVVLLTGERGVGKTGVCQRVVEETRRRGYCCSGVLSPAVFEGTEKRAIDLVDLSTGEARPLAVADENAGEIRTGKYRFLPATLEWGSRALERATPCHLLVVDELGPLEVELGQGLVVAWNLLDSAPFSLALVVVRPELVKEVGDRLELLRPMVLEVTSNNRDELPMHILALLQKEVSEPDLFTGQDGCIIDS